MSINRSLNLNHLPVFIAIAESKSLTEAARLLGQNKTRVSRILTELEADLNSELVYRTTRNLRLTGAGELFYRRCKEIVLNIDEAANQLSQKETETSGHICMTAAHGIASLLLPVVIRDFQKLYPKVTFEFRMTQQSLNLVKEGIDIALRVGILEDSSYIAKKVGNIHYTFVATPNFLKSNQVKKLRDVESAKTITFPHFNKKKLQFKQGSEQIQIRLNSTVVCNSPDLLLNFALQDLGIALLPESICRDHFRTGQLIRIFENWQTDSVPISLLFHGSDRKPKPVSIFIAFLSNYFASALD